MKKKVALVALLFLTTFLCFAQKSSLRKYYYWINQAELAICDSDFQRASDCYDNAFDKHRPFSGHVYYAFKLNTQYVHNDERALRYFHILCQSGEDIEWYREDSVMYASIWLQMKMIADTTKTMVIPALQEALENIRTSDQEVRRQMYIDDETEYNAMRYTDSTKGSLKAIIILYLKRYDNVYWPQIKPSKKKGLNLQHERTQKDIRINYPI